MHNITQLPTHRVGQDLNLNYVYCEVRTDSPMVKSFVSKMGDLRAGTNLGIFTANFLANCVRVCVDVGFWMALHDNEMSHHSLVAFLFCVMETYPKVGVWVFVRSLLFTCACVDLNIRNHEVPIARQKHGI